LTPADDFVGPLKRTSRQMVVLIAALTGIELLLIHSFSRRLARPIEGVSRDLRSVEDLTFSYGVPTPSNIREIKELQTAVKLFDLHLRIGLHCADVLVGNVGSSERLSYAVMGDGVNVAARLEGINKTFGSTICIGDSVVEAVEPEILARPIRKVQVKGRNREFMIYELLGIRASDDPELKPPDDAAKLCELTRDASSHLERGEFDQAARRYDDPVAKSLLAMCLAKARA
jgi:hypothetical protein